MLEVRYQCGFFFSLKQRWLHKDLQLCRCQGEQHRGTGRGRTGSDTCRWSFISIAVRKSVYTPEGLESVEHNVPDASQSVTFMEAQEAGGVVSLLINCLGAFNLPADQNHREAWALWNCSRRKLRQLIFADVLRMKSRGPHETQFDG